MKNRLIGWFSIILGVAVMLMWVIILLNGELPEGKTELTFHLASEYLMALFCLLSGFLLLRGKRIGRRLSFVAFGMVIYSVTNAAGYYGERGEKGTMLMFMVLLGLALLAILLQLFPPDKNHEEYKTDEEQEEAI